MTHPPDATKAKVARQLLVGPSQWSDLEASVHQVVRPGCKATLEQVTLEERDIGQPLLGDQRPRSVEQPVVHISPGHRSLRSDPLAQDAKPPQAPTAHVKRPQALPRSKVDQQGTPRGFPNAGLEL